MSSSNSPCAACKFLRRKCTQGCVFAPYFPPDNPQKFASVHRVFGASNVAKLLNELPAVQREDAVNSLAYEAQSRLHDPVYGCVGYISVLQSKLRQIQHDLEMAKKELSTYIGAAAYGPILPPPYQSQFAIPFHHQNQYHALRSSSSSSMNLLGMNSQMLISDRQQQQQQQLVEAQQLAVAAVAAAAAREQEMLRNLEQQQQYSGGGYVNPTGGNGGGAAAPLVMTQQQQQFENNAFQVQQQQLLQLHQFSDQTNNQTVGMGVGQPQVQRPKIEERGMESAVRHFEI